MSTHNITGEEGEKKAREVLMDKGYEILECNWKFLKFELDIIARKGDTLVIAEVKTRFSNEYGEPETFVKMAKQKRIVRAAHQYILMNDLDVDTRFDIIALTGSGSNYRVNHIEGAFYAMM